MRFKNEQKSKRRYQSHGVVPLADAAEGGERFRGRREVLLEQKGRVLEPEIRKEVLEIKNKYLILNHCLK